MSLHIRLCLHVIFLLVEHSIINLEVDYVYLCYLGYWF
jgi:hypothetical protein